MGHVRPTTHDPLVPVLDFYDKKVSIGEIVTIDGEGYIHNGQEMQPLRGRDMAHSLQTYNGRFIWPLDAYPDEVDAVSVAHGLACENRYGNQSPFPYPVAWHCVALSHVVPAHLARAALIHDASEAYLKDIPRTIRRQEPFKSMYEEIEERLLRVCFEHFDEDYDLMDSEEFLYYDVKMSWAEMHVWARENPVFKAKMVSMSGIDAKMFSSVQQGQLIAEAKDPTYIDWVEKCPRHDVWQNAERAWLERYFALFCEPECL